MSREVGRAAAARARGHPRAWALLQAWGQCAAIASLTVALIVFGLLLTIEGPIWIDDPYPAVLVAEIIGALLGLAGAVYGLVAAVKGVRGP